MTSEYDENLPLFKESAKTMKISKPGDSATSEIYSLVILSKLLFNSTLQVFIHANLNMKG